MSSEPATRLETLLAEASWLEGLARALVGDREEARDLVQEVWAAAAERGPSRIERPRAWLAEVLRNALRSRRRARGPRESRERALARDATVSGAGDVVARAEAQRALVEHVLALDEPWRSTVLLRFFDGLASEEIARRAGVPASTVRNRLAHALGLLRARLERSLGTDWMAGIAPLVFGGRRAGTGIGGAGGVALMGTMLKLGVIVAAGLAAGWWWIGSRPTAPASPRAEATSMRAQEPALVHAGEIELASSREPVETGMALPTSDATPAAAPTAVVPLPSGVLEIVVLDSGERCPHPGRIVVAPGWFPWKGREGEEPPEDAIERVLVDGGARIEGLAPDSYGVRASLADHLDLSAYVVVPESNGVVVTLASGTSVVEGQAWREDGRPMPDAKVALWNKQTETFCYTRTQEDGSYALRRLEVGPHFVSLYGYEVIRSSTSVVPGRNRLDFGSPEPRPHWRGTLRARSGAEHRGRMVLWIRRTPQDLTTRVVEGGRFDLRLLPGTYRIVGKPDSYSGFEVDLGEVEVPFEDIERDLVLPGARVSGKVRKVDGSPLAPAYSMSVGIRRLADNVGLRSVPVGEDGCFTIDAVEPGVYLLNTFPLIVVGGVDSFRFELLPREDVLALDVPVRVP